MHKWLCALSIGALTSTALAAGPAPEVSCGDEVTTSITLTEDLECDGTALVVTADDVSVDLGGHTLRYVGDHPIEGDVWQGPWGVQVGDGSGVGPSNVTIVNGRVEGFASPLAAIGFRDLKVHRLRMDRDILLIHGGGFSMTRSRLDGALNAEAHDVSVENSRINGSIFFTESNAARIVNNRFRNGGVHLNGFDNLVKGNRFDNARVAILFGGFTSGSKAIGNRIVRAHTGVQFSQFLHDDIVVRDNTITNSASAGIRTRDTVDPTPTNIVIKRNRIVRTGFRAGPDEVVDGIHIQQPTASGVTLRGNRVLVSAGHAIFAPGVSDGGSNRARVSGQRPACVGVTCR
jgi:hypothetical protein